MSIEVIARVIHHSKSPPGDQFILLAIANYADKDGRAWPAVRTIAAHANITPRAVQQALVRLTASGELLVHRQGGGTEDMRPDQRPNLYRVNIHCPAGCDGTTQHRASPLPRAAADLWTTGVKQPAPGEARFMGGVKQPAPGGGEAACTQTVTREPVPKTAHRSLTGPRARCSICSKLEDACRRGAATNGHEFSAGADTGS